MSANGRFVAYSSAATNLVAGDTNGKRDVFVYDRRSGRTTRESVTTSGAEIDEFSDSPSISDDGRFVVFQSRGTNIAAGASSIHLYLRDLVLGTTTLVDRTLAAGVDNESYPFNFAMNDDGRYVAFVSFSAGMVAGDTNGCDDVFLLDIFAGITERGSDGSRCADRPAISGDGRYVAFEADVNGNKAAFVRDRAARIVTLESPASSVFLDGSGSRPSEAMAVGCPGFETPLTQR